MGKTKTVRPDKARMEAEDKRTYRTTWTRPGGEIQRQIDDIVRNARYGGTAWTCGTNPHWRAEMHQNHQRGVQAAQIYNNKEKQIHDADTDGEGNVPKYDIKELRLRPEKLAK